MGKLFDRVGDVIARYLETPESDYQPCTLAESAAMRASLKPGDVLLVEGTNSISCIIKYLTQSTWSHAALYVGPTLGKFSAEGEPHVLIEANIGEGVVTAPLSKYGNYPMRVCRPIGLTETDCKRVCRHVTDRIGLEYDMKNILDLLRYLLPAPGSRRWRRRMTKLGSGDPTRIICSALIAQAFQAVHYPILARAGLTAGGAGRPQIPDIRDPSLYAPRDFDASPYFTVVKPAIENGFDYKALPWADWPEPLAQGEAEGVAGTGDENRLAPAGARQPAQLAA